MRFKYTIEEKDFLNYQLFAASTSKSINNKKLIGRVILSAAAGVSGIYFYRKENITLAVLFIVLTRIVAALYPTIYK